MSQLFPSSADAVVERGCRTADGNAERSKLVPGQIQSQQHGKSLRYTEAIDWLKYTRAINIYQKSVTQRELRDFIYLYVHSFAIFVNLCSWDDDVL